LNDKRHISAMYPNKSPEECCRREHIPKARELWAFLRIAYDEDLELKLWDSRIYEKSNYTAQWVSFEDSFYRGKLFIALGFTIVEHGISVYFRFIDTVNRNELGLVNWHKGDANSMYVSLEENRDELKEAISTYLENLRSQMESGTMRNFGNFKPSK
jgi:hypothetical protein